MSVAADRLLAAGYPRESTTLDREKVIAILRRRFPGATADQIAAAANALVGLSGDWREVVTFDSVAGRRFKVYEHLGD